ncbi:MAG: PilN domain-containing protein, partial [Terriglobia bacterium]
LVLAAAAGFTYYRHQNLEVQLTELDMRKMELERELADLNRIKQEYDANLARREALTARINVIEALKARQAGPVQLLSTLAGAVTRTDSLWLTSFTQQGQNITIEGTALNVKAVADFMTQLLNQRIFATVDLRETSQDPASREVENFSFILTGQLAAPTGPAPATTG